MSGPLLTYRALTPDNSRVLLPIVVKGGKLCFQHIPCLEGFAADLVHPTLTKVELLATDALRSGKGKWTWGRFVEWGFSWAVTVEAFYLHGIMALLDVNAFVKREEDAAYYVTHCLGGGETGMLAMRGSAGDQMKMDCAIANYYRAQQIMASDAAAALVAMRRGGQSFPLL